MKKLKIHKALLAICLALPITLSINKATNAMKSQTPMKMEINNAQNDNKSKNNVANETLNQEELFTPKLVEFANKYKDQQHIPDEEYIKFLHTQIKGRIEKYLALMIQIKNGQTPRIGVYNNKLKYNVDLINPQQAFHLLYDYDPNNYQQEEKIEVDSAFPMITKIIKGVIKTPQNLQTNEGKILYLLFTDETIGNLIYDQSLNKMQETLNEYKTEGRITLSKEQTYFIGYLDKVAKILKAEHSYLQSKGQDSKLEQIARILQDFSKTCTRKLKTRNNRPQKQEGTLLYTINQHKPLEKITQPLNKQELTKVLQKYINNDIKKYISLMIQTLYKELPYINPKNRTTLIEEETAKQLQITLFKDPQNQTDEEKLLTQPGPITQMSNIINTIRTISPQTKQKDKKILSYLFTEEAWRNEEEQEALNTIQKLINAYKTEENNTVEQNNSILPEFISMLGEVADQLDQENSNQNPEEPNSQLGQLAQEVKEFSEVYKRKQLPTLTQAIRDKAAKNPNGANFTDEDYRDVLNRYLEGDTKKYLSAMMQTNYLIIPKPKNTKQTTIEAATKLFNLLYKINPESPQNDDIIFNFRNKAEIYNFLKYIQKIANKNEGELTTEHKILKLLFVTTILHTSLGFDGLEQLRELLEQYKGEELKQKDKTQPLLISSIEQVAQQLDLEFERAGRQEDMNDQLKKLKKLKKRVRDFSQEYTKKHKATQSTTTNTDSNTQINSNVGKTGNTIEQTNLADTYTEAMDQFINDRHSETLFLNPDYDDFIKDYYIKQDKIKYLALLILSNLKLIPIPTNPNNEPLIDDQQLKGRLIDYLNKNNIFAEDPTKGPQKKFPTINKKTEQQSTDLQQYIINLSYTFTKDLKPKDAIPGLLISPQIQQVPIDQTLNKLETALKTYLTQENTNEEQEPPALKSFLSYLGPVAKQISRDYDLKDWGSSTSPLAKLVQLLSEYSDEYENKQAERKAKEEAERKQKEKEDRLKKEKEEKEQREKEEEEKERQEKLKREQEERIKKEKEEEEKKRKQQEEKLKKEQEERLKKEEERKKEEENKKKAEEEEKRKLEEERQEKLRKEEERLKKEEADNIAIKEIEQLIEEWIQQKETIINDKEAKLQQLEQAINSLEQKYDKIVKGIEVNLQQL